MNIHPFDYLPYAKAYLSETEGMTIGDAHAAKDTATNKNANLKTMLSRANHADVYKVSVSTILTGREKESVNVTNANMELSMEEVLEMLPEIAKDAAETAYYNSALTAHSSLHATIQQLTPQRLCETIFAQEFNAVKEKMSAPPPVAEQLGIGNRLVLVEGTPEQLKTQLSNRAVNYVTPELLAKAEKAFFEVQRLGALIKSQKTLFTMVSGKDSPKTMAPPATVNGNIIQVVVMERTVEVSEDLAKKYHELHQVYQKHYDELAAKLKSKLVDLQEILDAENAANLAAHNASTREASAQVDAFLAKATEIRSSMLRQVANMRVQPFG